MQQRERNSFFDDEWTLKKVSDFSIFADFYCGNEDLDDFIHNDAAKHREELLAETYSLLTEATEGLNFPVAFISFSNDAIPLSVSQRRKLLPRGKRYPFLPAVKIARLGVLKPFQSKNVGTQLINMARKLFLQDNRTGCRFITVDAYNEQRVIQFYQKNGFVFLGETDRDKETRTMYFDLRRLQPII